MEESSRSEEEEDSQVAEVTLPSSSRLQRNQAEKLRRDKLNQFINELAILVPMVASSAKKLDKTSVLRLSATFLRMHHTLVGKNDSMRDLAIPVEWGRTLLDGLQAILLVVTSTRKIVYVSENVERILGHHQNDLLGSDLKDITHKEDESMLNLNLEPRTDGDVTKMGTRRSFFLRLAHRPATRSDQPQYEMVRVEGHLRISKPQAPQNRSKNHAFDRYLRTQLSVPNGSGYGDSKGETGINSNDVVLVALVRPYKEMHIADNSLLEATKEEWLTRHLLDGTIVYADHRISVLSGYLSEEVHGNSAFQYIHRQDARWVMIALRQMFCASESKGWSCYRLKAKNGEYIYLRTQGYLEVQNKIPTTTNVQSFICINSLVSANEGEKLIHEMKTMFTPVVKKKVNPLAVTARNNANINKRESSPVDDVGLQPLETEDSDELKSAIGQLLVGLEEVRARPPSPNKRDQDYAKVEIVSKALPPVEVQTGHIGAKFPVLQGKYNRPSVITSITGSTERPKRPPDVVVEETDSKRMRPENRSVIVSEARSVIKRHEPELETSFMLNSTDIGLLGPGSASFSDDDSLKLPEDVSSSEFWELPVSDLEEGVLRGHMHLENRIQSQEVQIQEIEEDLQTVPLAEDFKMYRHITDLKAEHRKHQEMLKSLQNDHQNIHQAKEQLLRGTEQDIGA